VLIEINLGSGLVIFQLTYSVFAGVRLES